MDAVFDLANARSGNNAFIIICLLLSCYGAPITFFLLLLGAQVVGKPLLPTRLLDALALSLSIHSHEGDDGMLINIKSV